MIVDFHLERELIFGWLKLVSTRWKLILVKDRFCLAKTDFVLGETNFGLAQGDFDFASDNLTWRKGIFGWRKRFSGNTENVVGFEVLRKIVRRCFRGEVVRFNRTGVFGWYVVHCVC